MNKSSQPSRICSIDASTNSLAFAIFDTQKKTLITIGKINFEGKNTYEKVIDAGKKVKSFFDFYGTPDAIIIEQTVYLNSPKTQADLALVQGALLGAAGQSGTHKIVSVPPITWQTFWGNKRLTKEEQLLIRKNNPGKTESWYKTYERNFRKERTIKLVEVYYDRIVKDNDIADAIGIGHYAINNLSKLF